VPWWDPQDSTGYRCNGIDPEIFPAGRVPLKKWSPDHKVALEWFARAHRAGRISGPPKYLIEGRMDALAFLDHILAGDIIPDAQTSTLGFTKPLDQRHYQSLVMDLSWQSDEEAQRALSDALRAIAPAD
jgi:hypothetical protein